MARLQNENCWQRGWYADFPAVKSTPVEARALSLSKRISRLAASFDELFRNFAAFGTKASPVVAPAKAGAQGQQRWMPAFAGMTGWQSGVPVSVRTHVAAAT
ncbi:MAG: hypothetical protein HZB53_10060 [Chloroflexi bacterium]|nr:hypothetical protein [Chloroflexota bacterium]